MNASESIKALWANRELVALKNTPYRWMVGVFFMSIFLIAFPHYAGVNQGVQTIHEFVNIEPAFQSLYNERFPCAITEEAKLMCSEPSTITEAGDYQVVVAEDFNLSTTTQSTLYFGETRLGVVYVNDDTAFILEGDYRLLPGFNFQTINEEVDGVLVEGQNEATDRFLTAIYFSTVDEKIITIFVTQLFQTLIFVMVLTLVMLLLNLDSTRNKLTIKQANTMMIAGMVGPALITAVIGLIYPALGSIAFPFVYGFRMLFVYYFLRKNQVKTTLI